MPEDNAAKVAELLADQRIAWLTTTAPDGTLTSRPMGLQQVEFDGDLWFFTERDARKVHHVRIHPQVNVTAGTGSTWVSLTGIAHVVEDEGKKHELWNPVVQAWFADADPTSSEVGLLRVEATSAEYWDSPGGRVATLISFVKAKATGERFEGGENERVDL